jgi:hypothetical protein
MRAPYVILCRCLGGTPLRSIPRVPELRGSERVLAGYLLRRSTSRIYARGSTEAAGMRLHYDH